MYVAFPRGPDGDAPEVGKWSLSSDRQTIRWLCPQCLPSYLFTKTVADLGGGNCCMETCERCTATQVFTLKGWPIPEGRP